MHRKIKDTKDRLRRAGTFSIALVLCIALVPPAWAAPQVLTTEAPRAQSAGNLGADGAAAPAAALPEKYDARDKNLISPVRLQDPWGACWAFGSLAAMEANLVLQGLAEPGVQLSPRHLINFAGTPVGASAGAQAGEGQHAIDELIDLYGRNAVFQLGGHALEVASAISSGEGVTFEADYPYQNDEGYQSGMNYDAVGTWTLDETERHKAEYTVRNVNILPNPAEFAEARDVNSWMLNWDSVAAVKQAIIDFGAVSVSYFSSDGMGGNLTYYDAYNHTFFTNETNLIDHDVCIVGWDDTFPRERFTTGAAGTLPEYDGAWIVKNSWGSPVEEFPNRNDWGWEGYFYLSYCDRSAQGFTAWEMMPITTSIINQHDYMAQRSNAQTRITNYNPQKYANIFTASQDQVLSAVSVNTYAPATEGTVQIYRLSGGTFSVAPEPTQGTLLGDYKFSAPWTGYHRLQLGEDIVIKQGERFSVVVAAYELDAEGNRIAVASIEAGNSESMVSALGVSHYDTVIVNPGETSVLVTIDGMTRWIDGVDYAVLLHNEASDSAWYGNACIKVFANPYSAPAPVPEPKPAQDSQTSGQPSAGAKANSRPATATQAAVHSAPQRSAAKDTPAQTQTTPAPALAHATANTADTNYLSLFVFLFVIAGVGIGVGVRRSTC